MAMTFESGFNMADGEMDMQRLHRWLQAEADGEEAESRVLRDSIIIYGGLLVFVILIFGCVRRRFQNVYNIRSYVPEIKTYLADEHYRFFSWLWRVYFVTDDELSNESGMDAACFVRLIQMGYRLSLVGIFNLIWLLPLYFTSEESEETSNISDGVVKTSIANVPAGSARLFGTVIASYIFFGYTMYTILQELDWFVEMRHKYLRRPEARHFAVFVRNVPGDFQNNQQLATFFRQCFSDDTVLEARIPVKCPHLTHAVQQREATLANLEHAMAVYQIEGKRPRHHESMMMLGGSHVDSIEYYEAQLKEQNEDVAQRIAKLEAIVDGVEDMDGSQPLLTPRTNDDNSEELDVEVPSGLASETEHTTEHDDIVDIELNVSELTTSVFGREGGVPETESLTAASASGAHKSHKRYSSFDVSNNIKKSVSKAKSAAGKVSSSATKVAHKAVSLVGGGEDGEVHAAGFVVFTKLSTTNAALQMIHHPTPFAMEVLEAPDPDDVNWGNMGRSHKDLQVGNLLSMGLTVALCLLWTIPMAFIAGLSNVAAVREDVGWLDDLFSKYPGLVKLTEQLAPFLVIVFNSLLPMILGTISNFEGPISNSMLEASKFQKLAAFMIIQTFFVSAVSGSVMQAISDIIDDWTKIIDLLATTLPAQGTYFMQILLVSTSISAAVELLRVAPVFMAAIRSRIGPRLTEKERSKAFMGIRPLNDPTDFQHADFTSQLVLYFMVLFVYAVISPMTTIIAATCFVFMGSMFRYQFIHIYSKRPDSGGKVWSNFIQIMLSCMLIAQVTILGLLSLKKAAIQVPLFIPLVCITILFNLYIRQMHFRVASYLPTKECLKEDLSRAADFDMSFVKGAFMQPPLAAEKELVPESSLCVQGQSSSVEQTHPSVEQTPDDEPQPTQRNRKNV